MNFQQGNNVNFRIKNSLSPEIVNRNHYSTFSLQTISSENDLSLNNLTTPTDPSISILNNLRKLNERISSNETEKSPICVISEVRGNANGLFSESLPNDELPENYVITPKKTKDITKIKGWRRKQFFIEKPTTVEFYKDIKRKVGEKISSESKDSNSFQNETLEKNNAENVENAFVSESLDEFLNEESELKVTYEIPHLYAEVGIKLTSEEVYSKPNLTQDEFKKVEAQYYTALRSCDDDCKVIESEKLSDGRRKNKRNQEKLLEVSKTQKIEENKRRPNEIEQGVKEPKYKQREDSLLKETNESINRKNAFCLPTKYCHEDHILTTKLMGLVIYPSSFRPLHPLVQKHLFKIRSCNTKIDRNWANFAVLAVQCKSPNELLERRIIPAYCSGKVRRNSDSSASPIIEYEVKEVVQFLVNSVCEESKLSPILEALVPRTNKNDVIDSCEGDKEKNQNGEKSQQIIEINSTKESVAEEAQNFCRKLNANLNKICKSVNQNEKGKRTSARLQLNSQAEIYEISDDLDDVECISEHISSKNQKSGKVSAPQVNAKKKKILEKRNINKIPGLKDCKVVLEKLKGAEGLRVRCMEHNSYNCSTSSFNHFSRKWNKGSVGSKKKLEERNGKTAKQQPNQKFSGPLKKNKKILRAVPVSSKSYFDSKITSQLRRKLMNFNLARDPLSSVSRLKDLTPDTVELIKLNFMKESFSNGSVKIWYSPPQSPSSKSRAFLTLPDMPPVSGAFDISSREISLKNLPKIIIDMLSVENNFTNNELGILRCNGDLWELHGTLNLPVEKNNHLQEAHEEEVEQIFSPVPLPEMDDLRHISSKILGVRATKWWVMDMSQRFSKVVLTSSTTNTSLSKVTLLAFVKSRSACFCPLAEDKGRLYGFFYFNNLYPFVLIGPFYIYEKNDKISLISHSSVTPFNYNGKKNVDRNDPLKFFINSVIICINNSEKKLKGLWLYDEVCIDDTCYLEVITVNVQGSFPKSDYCLETEHGYSMRSLTNCPTVQSSKTINSTNAQGQFKPVPVYLYFEILALGYVAGELQIDNSVLITHPLTPGFRIKSHKVGEIFISLLKKRVKFIPENLEVKWFVTKHSQDLGGRRPFDKIWLGGVHLLCKAGIFSLLEMTEAKIKELGLNKPEVLQAASRCRVLLEIIELKKLKNLLFENIRERVTMEEILRRAVDVIRRLKEQEEVLESAKAIAEARKLNSMKNYVTFLNSCAISDFTKINYLEKVTDLYKTKYNGKLHVKFRELLEKFRFGQKYLRLLENFLNKEAVENTVIQIDSDNEETIVDVAKEKQTVQENDSGMFVVKSSILQNKPNILKEKKPKKAVNVSNNAHVETLETNMYDVTKLLSNNTLSSNYQKRKELLKKFNKISNQLNNVKSIIKCGDNKSQKDQICLTGKTELIQLNKAKEGIRQEEEKAEKKFIRLDSLKSSQSSPKITLCSETSSPPKNATQFEKLGEKSDQTKSPILKRQGPDSGETPVLKNLRVVISPLKKKYISSNRKILVVKNMKNNKIQKISILNPSESQGKNKGRGASVKCERRVKSGVEVVAADREAKDLEKKSGDKGNCIYERDVT